MKKPQEELKLPTIQFIKETIEPFEGNGSDQPRLNIKEVYYSSIKNSHLAVTSLREKFPDNNNLSEIYLKVAAINTLYSTNIYDTYRIAYKIFNNVKNLDERLKKFSPNLIGEIAKGHGIPSIAKEKNFYSFATKYCSFHNPNEYPIYDSYI